MEKDEISVMENIVNSIREKRVKLLVLYDLAETAEDEVARLNKECMSIEKEIAALIDGLRELAVGPQIA